MNDIELEIAEKEKLVNHLRERYEQAMADRKMFMEKLAECERHG